MDQRMTKVDLQQCWLKRLSLALCCCCWCFSFLIWDWFAGILITFPSMKSCNDHCKWQTPLCPSGWGLIISLSSPLIPYTHLTATLTHGFSRTTRDSWNVKPSWLSRAQGHSCSQWKESPAGIQLNWQSLLRKGGNLRGIWWQNALLPHLLVLLLKGGSCLSSWHTSSCPRIKRSDCTPRCFGVKSCRQKPHGRPQHKQDIHSL